MHEHTESIRKGPVSAIMSTTVETVHRDTSLHDLLDLFEEHETSSFPVVDDEGTFLGDVHERDLVKLAISHEDLNEHDVIGSMGTSIDASFFADSVADVMEEHEITAEPDSTVESVVLEMWKEGVRAVPVLEDGELVGMVYEEDIIENVVEQLKEAQ